MEKFESFEIRLATFGNDSRVSNKVEVLGKDFENE